MHVSSRWCVTAVLALGALACSDPVAPPAQGAFIAAVRPASPPPDGKACRVGGAFTYDVPSIWETEPTEQLNGSNYLHKVVDGEDRASVSCSVKGSSTFTFSGEIIAGSKAFKISNGTIGADKKGTANVTIVNSTRLSSSLSSPLAMPCTVSVAPAAGEPSFQIKAGSMWGKYDCAAVEAPPSDSCRTSGFFVLENCEQ